MANQADVTWVGAEVPNSGGGAADVTWVGAEVPNSGGGAALDTWVGAEVPNSGDGPALVTWVGVEVLSSIATPTVRSAIGVAVGGARVSGISAASEGIGSARGHATVVGIAQPFANIRTAFFESGPTSLQKVIRSYLYVQFNDDDDLQAFVASYNAYAQAYVDWFNALNLPIYSNAPVAGPLLDWVGNGLYNYPRPGLPNVGSAGRGALNTYDFNTIALNTGVAGVSSSYTATTDDIYRRCLTWHLFKGDGKQFSIRWLKRRIMRFLFGLNGVNFNVDQTYAVSITFTGVRSATIAIPPGAVSTIFQEAIRAGILELPFQISWTVTI